MLNIGLEACDTESVQASNRTLLCVLTLLELSLVGRHVVWLFVGISRSERSVQREGIECSCLIQGEVGVIVEDSAVQSGIFIDVHDFL